MTALSQDLAEESAELRGWIASLNEVDWRRDTPAEGWTIGDQIAHLAYFDDAAVRSAAEPEAFRAELEREQAQGGVNPDAIAARYRGLSADELLSWFDRSRGQLIETFQTLDPAQRVPWYGPAMSAASSLTARIMETWAHGQDVADTLGVRRQPTARLRHIAHIGVGARPFSYALHGRPLPTAAVRVELEAPDSAVWTWGPDTAEDRITGSALQFALLITQRRHRDDVTLEVVGPAAREWLEIGQAFAGAPGAGRRPGQFAR